jgi:hypothetical protein
VVAAARFRFELRIFRQPGRAVLAHQLVHFKPVAAVAD